MGMKLAKSSARTETGTDTQKNEPYIRKDSQPLYSFRSSKKSSGKKFLKSNEYNGSLAHIFMSKS
jgi:hypothetical protein